MSESPILKVKMKNKKNWARLSDFARIVVENSGAGKRPTPPAGSESDYAMKMLRVRANTTKGKGNG